MKYKIQWQDRWGKWQHYQTKTNEADAYRVMRQMVKQKGIRHRIVDENNRLIYGRNRSEYCNCYVDKYMNNSIPLIASLECHGDTLEKIESFKVN